MENRYEKETFSKIVGKSTNLSDVCRNLGLKPFYGNRQTIKKNIDKYNIDISHFKFHKKGGNFRRKDINDILIENSSYTYTSNLKERLYEEGLKERKCEMCGQGEIWNSMKISLILDHINGINNDNRLDNLRIVCPNCNAGLETHCGKNIKKSKYNYTRDLTEEKKFYCKCGNEIYKNSKMCKKCFDLKQRKIKNRPDKNILIEEVKKFGYSKTGKKYNVSDNTIRKWIK